MFSGIRMARAATAVFIVNLISRSLGFVRDASIGAVFGATGKTDAYLVAYTLPYALQAVLGMALVTVVVPVITGYLVKGQREEGWTVASTMLNGTALLMGAATCAGILTAPYIVKIMAPGFNPELTLLTSEMMRVMFPSILFMGVGMFATGLLNTGQIFTVPAAAPLVTNLVIILTVILFGSAYNIDVVAWGTLAGFAGFLIVQLPSLKKMHFNYRLVFNFRHRAVKKALISIIPVFAALSVNQCYLIINRFFASGLEPGSITALDFGYRLISLPLGIFVAAISTVIFPTMAEQAAVGKKDDLALTLRKGIGMVVLVSVPAAVGLAVLREPVVQLLFERGAFDRSASWLTASTVLYYSIGLVALGVSLVLHRAYYALGDLKTPVTAGLISIFVNVVLSIVFLPSMGHNGLALANSLAAFANTLVLLLVLLKALPSFNIINFGGSLGKMCLGACAMWLLSVVGLNGLEKVIEAASWGYLLVEIVFAAGLGVGAYVLVVAVLRLQEVEEVKALFGRCRG